MDHRYQPPAAPLAGSPLDQARATFEWLSRGPGPVTLDGRAFPGMPARPVALDELRDRLGHRSCRAVTRDAVWAHLVRRSRARGGTWTVACVGIALPTLAEVSTRLCRALPTDRTRTGPDGRRGAAGAVTDVESAVLSGFLTELAVTDLRHPRILARLRSAAHETGTLARREIEHAPTPRASLFTSCPPPPPARHPDLVLARAVAAGAITRGEAALVGSTRLEPITLAEIAAARGRTVRDIRVARVRAERKLAAFLRDADSTPSRGGRDDSRRARDTASGAGPASRSRPGGSRASTSSTPPSTTAAPRTTATPATAEMPAADAHDAVPGHTGVRRHRTRSRRNRAVQAPIRGPVAGRTDSPAGPDGGRG